MKLHLAPASSQSPSTFFNQHFIPTVRNSSILQLRKATIKNDFEESRLSKAIKSSSKPRYPDKADFEDDGEIIGGYPKHNKIPFSLKNDEIVKKRKMSDPKVELPQLDSQDNFFSIGEQIDSNDTITEEFFKREPEFILKVLRKATDVLLSWDFGYLDYFVCEVIGPKENIEQIPASQERKVTECGIFIPIETAKSSSKAFAVDDILIVESPFHLIDYTDPPLLVTPVIYHSAQSY